MQTQYISLEIYFTFSKFAMWKNVPVYMYVTK